MSRRTVPLPAPSDLSALIQAALLCTLHRQAPAAVTVSTACWPAPGAASDRGATS
jgi:hypothetical protein